MAKICYYMASTDESGVKRVRFSLRDGGTEFAVGEERWQRIRRRMAEDGYLFVERRRRERMPKRRRTKKERAG